MPNGILDSQILADGIGSPLYRWRARVVVSKATATDRVNKHVKAIDARTRRLRSSIEHPECPDSLHLHIVNCV